MPHRPSFDEFAALARDAHRRAGLPPAHRRHAHARLRVLQDPGGRLVVPVRERRRRRTARPLQLPRRRAVPARSRRTAPRVRTRDGTGQWVEARSTPTRCSCSKRCSPRTAPRTCRACRGSAAGPSATPATTPSATSSACRTPPPDDRDLPDLCFAFYDRMVIFDHINKTIARRRPRPRRSRPTCEAATTPPATASIAWSSGLQQGVADLQLTDIDADRPVAGPLPYRRTSRRTQFEAAVEKCKEYIKAGDIFQVVLSQRLAGRDAGPAVRHLPHAARRQPQPVHVLPARPGRLPRRRVAGDHGAASRATWSRSARWPAPAAAARRRRRTTPLADGAARRPEGAGRAHHARGPRPQRRRPGRRLGRCSSATC